MSQRRYLYFSQLHLVISKGGTNLGDLDALRFKFEKLKLHEVKLTT